MKTLATLRAALLALMLCAGQFALADELGMATVNINTADAKTLADVLVGVGPSRAKAIVAYRKAHGEFADVADLAKVKGIGLATVARNEQRILLED